MTSRQTPNLNPVTANAGMGVKSAAVPATLTSNLSMPAVQPAIEQPVSRSSRAVLPAAWAPPDPSSINQLGEQILVSLETGTPIASDASIASPTAQSASDPWGIGSTTGGNPFGLPAPLRKESSGSDSTQYTSNNIPNASSEQFLAPLEEDPEGSYRLGPGDSIDITVWDMPELARALVVRPDGYISYPLIREIKVEGRTPSQLEKDMETALSEHLVAPEVNIIVTSVGSKSYYVYGSVNNPGVYPHFRRTTLLQGIISAGGLPSVIRTGQPQPHGDLSRVRIIRTRDEGREVITKNLKWLTSEQMLSEDIPIEPEDIIYIPQDAQLVYVFGEVGMPGVIPIHEDTKLLEVILNSGGIRPTGKKKQVLVIHPNNGMPTYACVDMQAVEQGSLANNIPVQNGDIIYVPQKFIAKVAEFVQLYTAAAQPAMETYLTSWDAWFVHERFSALRSNNFGVNSNQTATVPVNPDP